MWEPWFIISTCMKATALFMGVLLMTVVHSGLDSFGKPSVIVQPTLQNPETGASKYVRLVRPFVPAESDSTPNQGEVPDKCPNCGMGPFVRDEESGELVCSNCGYVLLEREENQGPSFSTEEGRTEVASGSPTSIAIPDMGLSTIVGRADTDAAGGAISGKARSTIDRIRIWDRRSQARIPGIRGMGGAFGEIRTIAEKLSLGEEVVERAAYIYRKAVEKRVTRGRSTACLAAAVLYAAIREMQIPRSLKDIAASGNVDRKELTRSYRTLLNTLDIKMPIEDPIRSLARIGSAIDASPKTTRRAREILGRANAQGLSAGKDPMAQAGAALYLASQLEGEKGKTQKDVADAAEVTEVTLSAC
jgi:transcription initiation factor TFIIB